jgi:alpha-D-xyloside xylohydrolase
MISTASFGGLLWSPELRDARSETDFIRRMQTMLIAPQSVVNAWYLKNVPWFQLNREQNNAGVKHPNADKLEELVRNLFRERMSLIPYLYAAFADYYDKGLPPFRPLIMDYPKDKRVRSIANQFMIGQRIMAAPTTKDSTSRIVYFPEGTWYDYNSLKQYAGGKAYLIEIPMDKLPLFVKEGSIVPVATPLNFVDNHSVFEITCKVFGNAPAPFALFEDDGVTYDFQQGDFNKVILSVANGKGKVEHKGKFKGNRYNIKGWDFIK